MSIEDKIQSYLQEGEIYQGQALFDEARKRYVQATKLIKKSPELKNKKALLEIVSKKMTSLNFAYSMFQRIEASAQMSNREREHILNELLPPGRKSTGSAELEWAGALLSFGEYEMALNEFNKLLIREPALRVTAAKNILKCHTKLSSFDMAKTQYEMWTSGDLFTPTQLQRVKAYLDNSIDPEMKETISLSDADIEILPDEPTPPAARPAQKHPAPRSKPDKRPEKKAAKPSRRPSPIPETIIPDEDITILSDADITVLPDEEPEETIEATNGGSDLAALVSEAETMADDGPSQILSISIPLTDTVNEIGLEVDSQNGDNIRGIVAREDIVLLPRLQIGQRLEDVRFYSAYTMIVGACIVFKKTRLPSNDFALYLKVVDPFE